MYYDFQNLVFLLISAVLPLYYSSEGFLLLPTTMTLQDDNFFLVEPSLLKWFDRFMREQSQTFQQK